MHISSSVPVILKYIWALPLLVPKLNNLLRLAASVIIALSAGAIGSIFTSASLFTWYAGIAKPSFNPPDWVFGPVWTLLFVLMAISLFLVWKKGTHKKAVRIALFIYAVQLLLNILWSALFFGLQNPFFAFLEIIVLWAAILLTIVFFHRISRPAAWLLVPYLLWVSFAAVLNITIYLLNS